MTDDELRGNTLPRLYTKPLVTGRPGPCGCGCALTPETTLGFSLLAFIAMLGIELIPWQRWLAIHAFELHADGPGRDGKPRFRYRTLLILIARQNGKTTWVELKNLWKMFVLQVPLVIGTAQKIDLAEESWTKAIDIAESVPELAVEIAKVDRSNGKKALVLTSGSRWKIEPATRGGGRGLSGDDVNLDELREHRKWDSWGAVTKTTMARPNAQIFAFTNAGDDQSVVLNTIQGQARSAATSADGDPSIFLAEWSVPDDVKCTCRRTGANPHRRDCQLQDRRLWAMANPSLGYGTLTETALASALATDPEGIFRTECLCQRVPDLGGAVIDPAAWEGLTDVDSRPELGNVVFAVDVSPSGDYASIASYSVSPSGAGHLEVVDHREGTRWVPERVATLKSRYDPIAIVLDGRAQAGAVLLELARLGLPEQKMREILLPGTDKKLEVWDRGGLFLPSTRDVTAACGQFVQAVRDGDFRHIDQTSLTVAIGGAKARTVGDAWAWGRRLADVDISPLVAATLARYAHAKLADRIAQPVAYDVLDSVL